MQPYSQHIDLFYEPLKVTTLDFKAFQELGDGERWFYSREQFAVLVSAFVIEVKSDHTSIAAEGKVPEDELSFLHESAKAVEGLLTHAVDSYGFTALYQIGAPEEGWSSHFKALFVTDDKRFNALVDGEVTTVSPTLFYTHDEIAHSLDVQLLDNGLELTIAAQAYFTDQKLPATEHLQQQYKAFRQHIEATLARLLATDPDDLARMKRKRMGRTIHRTLSVEV